jgi:hypothetical protein
MVGYWSGQKRELESWREEFRNRPGGRGETAGNGKKILKWREQTQEFVENKRVNYLWT